MQVRLCDPCLSALRVCVRTKMALYKYSSFSFLSGTVFDPRNTALDVSGIWNDAENNAATRVSHPSMPGADQRSQRIHQRARRLSDTRPSRTNSQMDAGDELDVAERRGGSDYRNCRRGVRHAPRPPHLPRHASLHPPPSPFRRLTGKEPRRQFFRTHRTEA